MDDLRARVLSKLTYEEALSENPHSFWLEHQKYLRENASRELLESYLFQDIGGASTFAPPNECEQCQDVFVGYDSKSDDSVCLSCGFIQRAWRQPFSRVIPSSCIYSHQTHLHHILHELQCHRHVLPDFLIADIRDHLKNNFTYERIKKCLRKCGYKQHYNMIPSIQRVLDENFVPLELSNEEERLIQGKFFIYISLGKLEGCKNRLNYHFVLSKISQMLGLYHVLPHLHLPKGKVSLERHERLWKAYVEPFMTSQISHQ